MLGVRAEGPWESGPDTHIQSIQTRLVFFFFLSLLYLLVSFTATLLDFET